MKESLEVGVAVMKVSFISTKSGHNSPEVNQQPGNAYRRVETNYAVGDHKCHSNAFADWRDSEHRDNPAFDLLAQHHLKPQHGNAKYERENQELHQEVSCKSVRRC